MKTRFALLLSLVLLLSLFAAPTASAASQTISLSMPTTTTTGFTLSLKWTAVTGVSYYDVRYEKDPNVSASTSTQYTTTSATSLSSTMNTTIGYRFFRIYAYNASGTLLAYSNVVGIAKYPSGVVVRMKQDATLTNSYPDPASSPNATYYKRPVWFITVDSTVRAAKAAANFTIGEFISETGLTSAIVDPLMVQHSQNARNRYGVLVVNSGYRSPAHNRAIGGATYSRHMWGDAVDMDANTSAQYSAINSAFAAESPSYVESFAEGGYNHWHGDWRYEAKGYQNW
ncbi:MAG TPA: D-Ala-D-Ala carboxypeptidase family metallohydrolase [Symbiobacteriaceae bacterium]|nr:D-Ala-D-Ala carboxypeptidase family metallohydrolase [Symbiobacteriaceae bacterium]